MEKGGLCRAGAGRQAGGVLAPATIQRQGGIRDEAHELWDQQAWV